MADILKSVELLDSGHVHIVRMIDGNKWRRAIMPHEEAELDEYAPDIDPRVKQEILDKWATTPVPVPEPLPPPKTDVDTDAEMNAYMDNPFMKSVLEGLVELLPQPTNMQQLRDVVKTRGRENIPR